MYEVTEGEHLGIKWKIIQYGYHDFETRIYIDYMEPDLCSRYGFNIYEFSRLDIPEGLNIYVSKGYKSQINKIIEQIIQRQYAPGGTKYKESENKILSFNKDDTK